MSFLIKTKLSLWSIAPFTVALSLLLFQKSFLWNGLSYDEATQFYYAKGVSPDAISLSQQTGTLGQALRLNATMNFDPGGFTFLLHNYSYLGNQYFFLKTLPLLFSILTLVFCYLIFFQFNKKHTHATLLTLLFFLVPSFREWSFTLRSYPLEICGTIYLFYFLQKLSSNQIENKDIFKANIILSLFITTRYSAWLTTLAFILTYLVLLWHQILREKKKFLLSFIPLLLSMGAIYHFTLKFQIGRLISNTYYESFILANKSLWDIYLILKRTLITREGVFLFIFLLFYFLLSKWRPFSNFKTQFKPYLIFSIIILIIHISLSAWNLYPFTLQDRFGVSLNILCYFQILLVMAFVFSKLKLSHFLSIPITLLLIYIAFTNEHINAATYRQSTLRFLPKEKEFWNHNRFAIDQWTWPEIRYFLEYDLKVGQDYEQKIMPLNWYGSIFEKQGIMLPQEKIKQYDYLILAYRSEYERKGIEIQLGNHWQRVDTLPKDAASSIWKRK